MIRGFRSRALRRVFAGDVRGVQLQIAPRLRLILVALNRAQALSELSELTGFHALRGNRQGECAVTVTRNWRVTFTPEIETREDGAEEFHVRDVDYEDYH